MRTIASVPFVNARPLVASFEDRATTPDLRVTYGLPSTLPGMLDDGRADAVLASSFEILREPTRKACAGVSISSFGAAESVRLFSKPEFSRIESLALDRSSMTSNHLALVMLQERYGAPPQAEVCEPDLGQMLATHDAAVLIGDRGMSAVGEGLHVLDLGSCWTEWTGLPFVWALWIGATQLDEVLATELTRAKDWGQANLNQIVEAASAQSGWSLGQTDNYLRHVMNYDLGAEHLAGLKLFQQLLFEHRYIESLAELNWVSPLGASVP